MSPDLKSSIDAIASAFDLFKSRNDVRLDDLVDRLEELESHRKSPGRTMLTQSREHYDKFTHWLRKANDPTRVSELGAYQADLERRGMTIGSDPGGGFAVPEEIAREVERLERQLSPVRRCTSLRAESRRLWGLEESAELVSRRILPRCI